jgi:hypothetical protein
VTSTAGTDEHPEVSEISAFDEGILPPERSADLRGHLAQCELCADVRSSLSEIRALLGTLPGPPRMPEDVAGRIDAALAAEALISATGPSAPADFSGETEPAVGVGAGAPAATGADATTASAPQPAGSVGRAHVSRETSPTTDRPSGHSSAATGPGRTRRNRRARKALATVCAAAVVGLGGLLVHSFESGGSGATTASPAKVGTFSGVRLPDRVHQLITAGAMASPNVGAQPGHNSPFSATAGPVPKCVLAATGRTVGPIATSAGTYDGRSSYLVVLPHPADVRLVDAYVIDSSCVASGSAKPGKVLTRQTYDRH